MVSIKQRIRNLERAFAASDFALRGSIDMVRGEAPAEAMRRASTPGLYTLFDPVGDTCHLGQIDRAGTITILCENR